MTNDEVRRTNDESRKVNLESEPGACRCPYCDAPVSDDSFVCQPCRVKLAPCPKCGKPRAETARRCPHCGENARPAAK